MPESNDVTDAQAAVSYPIDNLTYDVQERVVNSIYERIPAQRFNCTAQQSDLGPGGLVDIDIQTSNLLDLSTLRLSFELDILKDDGSAVADPMKVAISNAMDWIDLLQIEFQNQKIEDLKDPAAWTSAVFMAMLTNRSFCKSEGSVGLGMNNQIHQTYNTTNYDAYVAANGGAGATAAVLTYARKQFPNLAGIRKLSFAPDGTPSDTYEIPMGFMSGFCRTRCLLPCMQQILHFKFTITPIVRKFISLQADAGTFRLKNIHMKCDVIRLEEKALAKLALHLASLNPGEALIMPYMTYLSGEVPCQPYNTMQFTVPLQNRNNILSLHLLRDNRTQKAGTDKTKWALWNQSFPMSKFRSLEVTVNATRYTPAEKVRGLTEAYNSGALCHGLYTDPRGAGWLDKADLHAEYFPSDKILPGLYGLCPLSTSFEKTVLNDDTAIGRGISARSGQLVNVTIETGYENPATETPGTDRIMFCIVCRQALKFIGLNPQVDY